EQPWLCAAIDGEVATRSAGESLQKKADGGDACGTCVEAGVCVGTIDAAEGEDWDGGGCGAGGAEQVEVCACGDFTVGGGLLQNAIFGDFIFRDIFYSNYIFGGYFFGDYFFEDGAEEDEGWALVRGEGCGVGDL